MNNDAVVAAELAILQSGDLRQRVIDRIGLSVIYPKMKVGPSASAKAQATAKAVAAMGKAMDYGTAPDLPEVRLSFKHENPEMAARVLNTLMDEYLVYRRTILLNSNGPALQTQKASSESQLDSVNAAYQTFLSFNGIGDFDAEKASLTQVLSDREQQRYTLTSALQDAQARLTSLTSQLASTPREEGVYRDLNLAGEQSLDALRLRRTQAAATYRDDSDMIRMLDQQIADQERAQRQAPAASDTARRIGVNPVHQTLESDRNNAQAQVNATRASLVKVTEQIGQINDRLQQLAALEPEYRRLVSERTILQDSVTDFSRRAQESTASDAIARNSNDNIRIISRASPPVQGSSRRKLVAMVAVVLAVFTALCAALLNIFLKPGLPTAVAAGRTLDLPVLATARVKR